jgi:hypothetical protein
MEYLPHNAPGEPDNEPENEFSLAEGEQSFINGTPRQVVEKFLLDSLQQAIDLEAQDAASSSSFLKEWSVSVVQRTSGLTQGLLDFFYNHLDGRRYRSRTEIMQMQFKKYAHSSSRAYYHSLAREYREKLLLIFLLNVRSAPSTAIALENCNSLMLFPVEDLTSQHIFFSFGNITVLEWGKIIDNETFHNSNQLFPLGFKCLRQEHDVVSDIVVDCLCEIDAICRDSIDRLSHFSSLSDEDQNRALICSNWTIVSPLFRITICWINSSGENELKVYEARSPQQAWQAAMLESLEETLGKSFSSDKFGCLIILFCNRRILCRARKR